MTNQTYTIAQLQEVEQKLNECDSTAEQILKGYIDIDAILRLLPETFKVILLPGLKDEFRGIIPLIKEVRATTSASLYEAKSMVDNAPSVILSGLTIAEADELASKLERASGFVKIEKS